ncbi:hypothetical protein [Flavobacterium nackdongense]|uniref:Signal peptidase n=1 Tax=Flavobacterium nackdongense TaxID=2547394 RepID=A0A4P6YC50_9FLAO|nr:hypothetical protein [Flavobacterium nackdongense]QBN17873.1 hypothetical protein E1750_03330 [Flavobacterium nackdongense]
MKNNVLKYYIATLCFCCTFIAFAQPGDGNGGTGDGALEGGGDTTPTAPISDYLWVLALVGLVFAVLKLRTLYKNDFQSKD